MGESEALGEIFCGVNTPDNMEELTDLEKKHLPVIEAPEKVKVGECFGATVEIGKLLEHPNEPDHFIEFIELYAGETYLTRLALTAARTCPTLKICLNLEKNLGPLTAYARCNKHGVWKGEKNVCVEE